MTTLKHYNPSDERIDRVTASGKHGKQVMDLTLEYDLIGNLSSRREIVDHKSETFLYDALNRLWKVGGNKGPPDTSTMPLDGSHLRAVSAITTMTTSMRVKLMVRTSNHSTVWLERTKEGSRNMTLTVTWCPLLKGISSTRRITKWP